MNIPHNGDVCIQGCWVRGNLCPLAKRRLRRAPDRFRRHAAVAAIVVFLAPFAVRAQSNAAPARITARIDESRLTTLRGNTHPLARAQYDQGAVADSQPLRRMLLLLQRSPAQETALRTLIDQQQSKDSPNFHQWLTPQQFGRQFGPAAADIQTVTGWLQSHGFQIARVSAGGTLIEFSGTAGQVLSAFHTQIHRYVVNGQEHFANSSDPQIPAALAPVVAGPVSLHNFSRKAQSRNLGVFKKDLTTGQVVPQFSFGCRSSSGATVTCNALGPGDFAKIYSVQSLWDSGIDGTGQTIAIVGDSEICTANSPDFATTCASNDDVKTFRSIFGLSITNLPNVIVDGPDPGFNNDEIEGNLDVQWSGGVARGATIDFVIAETTEASAGVDLAAEYIVDNNLAPVMSESFGTCEASLGTAGNEFYLDLWEQAAAQGITVIVSAGDDGSAGCDDQNTETAAGQNGVNFGPGVNGIASTPFNVATGGTDFDITAPAYQTTYWGPETADSEGVQHISALHYIPETTWNDSCAQNFTGAETGCTSPPSLASLNIVAGSGGQSNCIELDVNGFCDGVSYNKPAWQAVAVGSGFTAGNDLSRDLPDVSLFAADGLVSNSFYAICDANFSSGPCDATPGSIDVIGVGGTSSSAPTFAGIMALLNQKMTSLHGTNSNIPTSQGNANYVLYHLFANQTGACTSTPSALPASTCTFNDTVRGNNSVPCVGTTLGCSDTSNSGTFGVLETLNLNTDLPTGTLAFNSGTGYDMASGLGSINAANLVSAWGTAVGAFKATTTTLCLWTTSSATCPSPAPTSISITHGQTVKVAITVTPNPFATVTTIPEDTALVGTFTGGTPGCNVTGCNTSGVDHFNFPLNNVDIYPLGSNGAVVGSTTFLVGGNYSVVAHYAGDGTNGASFSTSPIAVTVSPETSTTQVSTDIFNFFTGTVASNSSAYYGDSIIIRADVVGTSSGQESATGSITFSDESKSIGVFPLNSEGYAEDQTASNVTGAFTQPLAVGAHSFTASFGGDPSYGASSTLTAASLAVVQAPTTTAVTPSATTVAANTAFSISVFVDTQSSSALSSGGSSGAAPTGTVTFSAGGTVLGTAPVSGTLDSNFFVAAEATLANAKLTATSTITAAYSGDGNYTASTSPSVTVTVTGGPVPTITLLPAAGTITVNVTAPGQSGQTTVTVDGSNGFSGAVMLSSSVSPTNLSDPPTCSFATNPLTLSSTTTSAQTMVTCNTTAVSSQIAPTDRQQDPVWPLGSELVGVGAVLLLLGLTGITKQKRRVVATVSLGLFAVVAILVGCGSSGGSNPGGSNPGTTVGTYTVTVTATPPTSSGATAQSTTITLTVQ